MARPSKAAERTQQIADATVRTIAKYGYAGATLDRIAQETGLARGHVRHYVGNRQDLIKGAVKYYFEQTNDDSVFPEHIRTAKQALNYLFGEEFVGTREENAVMLGFLEAARSDENIAQTLLRNYTGVERDFARFLTAEHPELSAETIKRIAFAIVAMAIHNIFLLDISEKANTTALARSAANLVLESMLDAHT